jgi:hypothetical protein
MLTTIWLAAFNDKTKKYFSLNSIITSPEIYKISGVPSIALPFFFSSNCGVQISDN